MDKFWLLQINREWTNPFLDWLMATMTNFEVWLPLLAIAVLIMLWKGNFRVRSFVFVTLVTIAFTDGIFTQFTKQIVNRPRPSQSLADVREVSLQKTKPAFFGVFLPVQASLSEPPEGPVTGRSFPSGHAMNNTVIAIMAILFFGRRGALYILPAALVAYSRIYCGSHWPSDILVSILLAAGFSLVAASGFNGLYERFAPRMFPALFQRHPSLLGSYRR